MLKLFGRDSDAWSYLAIFLLASCLFLPIAISGHSSLIPLYEDLAQWPLYRQFVNDSFARYFFPLWCEGLYSGLDFAGWGHASAFYPMAIFFFLYQYALAATLNEYLHFLIGVSGYYFLAKTIGLKREGALVSAMGYGFTYFLAAMVGNIVPPNFTLTYVTWAFALAYRIMQRPTSPVLLALPVVMALQITGGHFEMVALQNISLILLMAVTWTLDPSCKRQGFRPFALLFLVFAFSGLLASITLLPSLGSYGQSYRVLGFTYDYYARSVESNYAYIPTWLMLFCFPTFLLFVAYAFKDIRKPVFLGLMAVSLFSLFSSLNWLDYFKIFYHLPILNKFPPRGIALHLTVMSLFLIFGMGLDGFPKTRGKKTALLVSIFLLLETAAALGVYLELTRLLGSPKDEIAALLSRFVLSREVIFIYLVPFTLTFSILALLLRKQRIATVYVLEFALVVNFLLTGFLLAPRNSTDVIEPDPEYSKFLSSIDPGRYRMQSVYPSSLWFRVKIPVQIGVFNGTRAPDAFIFLSTLRYTEFLKTMDSKVMSLKGGKVDDVEVPYLLKFGDFVSLENLPLINLLNLKYIVGQAKNIKAATEYNLAYEYYRFAPRKRIEQSAVFNKLIIHPPAKFGITLYLAQGDILNLKLESRDKKSCAFMLNLSFGSSMADASIFFSREVNAGDEIQADLKTLAGRTGNLMVEITPTAPCEQELEMSAVIKNPSRHFRRLHYQGIDIFENPSALERFFLVHGAVVLPDKNERLAFLKSANFAPEQTALLERKIFLPLPQKAGMLPGEEIRYFKTRSFSGRIELELRNRAEGILIFNDQYYPGWRAFLDGRETRVLPVDHCFQGVLIPYAGGHRLVFSYEPASFELGMWTVLVSLFSWLACLSAVILFRPKSRRV